MLSLKVKFLVPTLIFFAIGMGIIAYTSDERARATLQSIQERDARELAEVLTSNVSKWLSSIKKDASIWSTRQEFVDFAPSSRDTLKMLHADNPLYAGISTMGTNGVVVYATTEKNEGTLDLSDRDYIKAALSGTVGISDINISKVTGLPVVAVAAPLKKDGTIVGAVYMTVNIPALTGYFFQNVSNGKNGYIMMFNSKGGFLSHPHMEEMNKKDALPDYVQKMLNDHSGILYFTDESGEEFVAAFVTDDQLGWVVASCYQVKELYAEVAAGERLNMIVGLVVLVAAAILLFLLVLSITIPLNRTVKIISELAQGEGDLTLRLKSRSHDEVGKLTRSLNMFIEKLWHLIGQIKDNTDLISDHAETMNNNNAEINQRTTHQTSALEKTSQAVSQITSSVQNTADNAGNAHQKTELTFKLARQGGEVLNQAMSSMGEVTEASRKIHDIINVVNEIAFQTNLLALNASVEAARAGAAGESFSVVAGEVRNLATRSAQAAKEIQELISSSVAKIQTSNELVSQSDEILKTIISSVQEANDTIAEISSASHEQSSGINEISTAMQQMEQGVSRTAEMVSNNFELSNELNTASATLVRLVSKFRL